MEQPQGTELLKQRARAVQTVVSGVGSMKEALDYAIEITQKQGGSAIAAPAMGKHASVLGSLCKKNGLSLFTKSLRDHIGAIDTGLTLADWGISETATLAIDSTSEDVRIATMLCETHVAVLPESRIVPDTAALEEELTRAFRTAPRYMAFISGASRTADIERVLTIGVHGPRELHLLILEENRS